MFYKSRPVSHFHEARSDLVDLVSILANTISKERQHTPKNFIPSPGYYGAKDREPSRRCTREDLNIKGTKSTNFTNSWT